MATHEAFMAEVAEFRAAWPTCVVDGKHNDTNSGDLLIAWFLFQVLQELRKAKPPK